VRVPPRQVVVVQVQSHGTVGTAILEPILKIYSLEVGELLLAFSEEGTAQLVVSNLSGFTRIIQKGTTVSTAFEAMIVDPTSASEEAGISRPSQGDITS
jgi:hypothetical protein